MRILDDTDGEMILPGLMAGQQSPRPRAKIREELAWLADNARMHRAALRGILVRRVVLWVQLVWPPKVSLEPEQ